LVPGILPLICLILWVVRVHSRRYLLVGLLILLCLLAYHYLLVAFAMHSDRAYVGVQVGEIVLFGFAVTYLLKPQSV
jgi:uncharacterized membrane protein